MTVDPSLLPIRPPDQRAPPKRFARIPSPEKIVAWWGENYRALTGREATGSHLGACWHVMTYLAANPGLEPEDLELVVAKYDRWRESGKRTRRERLAFLVFKGYDRETGRRTSIYVLPRSQAMAGRRYRAVERKKKRGGKR